MAYTAIELHDLKECETRILHLENMLAADGEERLGFHLEIGDQLWRAKKSAKKNFALWVKETFSRGHEWRCTHMKLANRRQDIPQARMWAEREKSKLANLFSVDGVLSLLRAWDDATGRAANAEKKRARTRKFEQEPADSVGPGSEFDRPDKVRELELRLRALHEEAARFRKALSLATRDWARSCLLAFEAGDQAAEQNLRFLAQDNCWLFEDLCDDLRKENSGAPEFSSLKFLPPPEDPCIELVEVADEDA